MQFDNELTIENTDITTPVTACSSFVMNESVYGRWPYPAPCTQRSLPGFEKDAFLLDLNRDANGHLDPDGVLDVADINALGAYIIAHQNQPALSGTPEDIDENGVINECDAYAWLFYVSHHILDSDHHGHNGFNVNHTDSLLPVDHDLDENVDGEIFILVNESIGESTTTSTTPFSDGDFNFNGTIDLDDLALVVHFVFRSHAEYTWNPL